MRATSRPLAGGMNAFLLLKTGWCLLHLFAVLAVPSEYTLPKNLRVVNQRDLFKKWPDNRVYFYVDSRYTAEEGQLIRLAVSRVTFDLKSCVTFVEVYADAPQFKVKITPLKTDSQVAATYCHTYPGMYETARLRGEKEQQMTIIRGPYGCLDGSLHRLMKYFALLLGKRNEHQRSDRDGYIRMNNTNILPEMINFGYRKYSNDEAITSSCPYDYCSITHNQPSDFVVSPELPGAFTVKNAPFFIPSLDRLSECDCKELSTLYKCDVSLCAPLDCAAQIAAPNVGHTDQLPTGLPSPGVPYNTASTNPAVVSIVTTTNDITTICYSLPAVMQQTEFSVTTTVGSSLPASTVQQGQSSQTDVPITCIITAGPVGSTVQRLRPKPQLRVVDTDPKYIKWPHNQIPYYIDSRYSASEKATVQKAIATVTASMMGCVRFVEVPPTSTNFKLKITPFALDGITQEKQCYSYPGIYEKNMKTTGEQNLVLARGPDGCLGGTKHNILKYFAIVLGKRTEHQRPDRDAHIGILPNNIMAGMDFAYEKYDWTHAKAFYPYDYCSVTHNQPDIFAKPGTQAFTVKDPPYRIPVLDRFSENDCKELSEVYSCDAVKCEPLDCKSIILSSTQSTTFGSTNTSSIRPATTKSPIHSSTLPPTSVMVTALPSATSTTVSPSSMTTVTFGVSPTSITLIRMSSPATAVAPTTPALLPVTSTAQRPSSSSVPSTSVARPSSINGSSSIVITGGTSTGTTKAGDSTLTSSNTTIGPTAQTSTSSTSKAAFNQKLPVSLSSSLTTTTTTIVSFTSPATSIGAGSVPSSYARTDVSSVLTTAASTSAGPSGRPISSSILPCSSSSSTNSLLLPFTVSSTPQSGIQVCYRFPPMTALTTFSARLTLSPADVGHVGFVEATSTCPPNAPGS